MPDTGTDPLGNQAAIKFSDSTKHPPATVSVAALARGGVEIPDKRGGIECKRHRTSAAAVTRNADVCEEFTKTLNT